MSLAELIVDAYGVKSFQIVGLPPWGDSDVYDLDAEVAGPTPPTVGRVRLMLQTLLADRFQLKIHHQSRVLPVYSLVAKKKDVKLFPDKAPCLSHPGFTGQASRTLRRTDDPPLPWAFYVESLTTFTKRPIIDETGLNRGGYCTADGVDPQLILSIDMEGGASIFTAVEEKWGMRLVSRREPVDVVVIDMVERPSGN